MGRYDTYFKGPVLSGGSNDNITALDAGSVILSQQQTFSPTTTPVFSGTMDIFFQIPQNVRLKDVYIDFGLTPGAGTFVIAMGTAANATATPLVIVPSTNVSTTTPRNLTGFSNSDVNSWALIANNGANTFLRVSLVGITTSTRVSVLISYMILPTA